MSRVRSQAQLVLPAQRTVQCAEALAWLRENPAQPGMSVVTSLPDHSEMSGLTLEGWKEWFTGTVRTIIGWTPDDGVAIFFQSDVRHQGVWVDKGYLVMKAADAVEAPVLWHKIVCRRPAGTITPGRPSYSHMICVSRVPHGPAERPGPDVLPDAGFMAWPRAMGEKACVAACRYLRDETATRIVVDPFCGEGSLLAAANSFGFGAIGVDLSPRRCRIAVGQTLSKVVSSHKTACLS